MENNIQVLVSEQQKTNELLTQLVNENHKRSRRESHQFWIGLIWHLVPFLVTIVLIWQTYIYVNQQITDVKQKVSHTFDLNNIKDNINTLFN